MRARSKMLVLAVLAASVVSMAVSAHARQCSITNVAGTYGFSVNGTLILPIGPGGTAVPVPVNAVGTITLHPDGTASGKEDRSVGGQFAKESIGPASWSVNADCTGKLTAEVFVGTTLNRTSVLRFVVDDNLSEIRVMQESLTFADGSKPPAVISFEGRRIFNNHGQD